MEDSEVRRTVRELLEPSMHLLSSYEEAGDRCLIWNPSNKILISVDIDEKSKENNKVSSISLEVGLPYVIDILYVYECLVIERFFPIFVSPI